MPEAAALSVNYRCSGGAAVTVTVTVTVTDSRRLGGGRARRAVPSRAALPCHPPVTMESRRPPPPPPLLALVLGLLAAAAAVHGQSSSDWFTDEELRQLDIEPERGAGRTVDGFRTDFLNGGRRRSLAGRQYQVRLVGGNSKQGKQNVEPHNGVIMSYSSGK